MADNPKFKTARMKAEQKIYELMDDLEGCKDGYNLRSLWIVLLMKNGLIYSLRLR